MEIIIYKALAGFVIGIVYDMVSFIFMRNQLPVSALDSMLIVTPFIFSVYGILSELPEYADNRAKKQSGAIIYLWFIIILLVVEVVFFEVKILHSTWGIILNACLSLYTVHGLFHPVILYKWNPAAAVIVSLLTLPVAALYFALLAECTALFILLTITAVILMVQSY